MNPLARTSRLIRRTRGRLSDLLARRWRTSFYLYLAGVFTLFILADFAVLRVTGEMRQTAFDAMVRYRIVVPKPDPDIVVVDIDEASLAAMAKDYGRWPWPRQVLGEFLEQIEQQKPKAVVFDILFSDADVYNPDSDAYFDAAVAATDNTFFPMLRLDPASDSLSQVKPAMIPGVVQSAAGGQPDATVAVVLPHFESALKGGRLGLHNISPDVDGTVRQYLVRRDDYGWELPSLPLRVARQLGWGEPAAGRILLNWRGKPFSYRYVGFADVFMDMGSKVRKRPQDEFTGKIVLIGSTAPSLFDVKPTPLSKLHPGVEILATAIDNLKHRDYLRFPEAPAAFMLLTLAMVWTTAWAFYRDTGRERIDRLFGASQFLLLGISYASINFTNTYINLTGPVTVAIAYFTVARIYAAATGKALEHSVVRASAQQRGRLNAFLLLIRIRDEEGVLTEKLLEKLRQRIERIAGAGKGVEVLKGSQKGIWNLLENTVAVSWIAPSGADDAAAGAAAEEASAVLLAALPAILREVVGGDGKGFLSRLHRGAVAGGERARDDWRGLLGEALLNWNRAEPEGGSHDH